MLDQFSRSYGSRFLEIKGKLVVREPFFGRLLMGEMDRGPFLCLTIAGSRNRFRFPETISRMVNWSVARLLV